jgi:DNA repair exonuclease SbcCD ATPase subunit
LVVRTQSGGQWSNHADGQAIDIDPDTNPRLIDPKQRAVISALTETDVSDQHLGYAGAAEASERFQSRYSVTGLAERSEEIYDDEHGLEAERQEIHDKLDVLGKEKRPTADQKAQARTLREQLKAKQAEIRANLAAQQAISHERDRLVGLEKAVADVEQEIEKLQGEIDALDATKDTRKIAAITLKLKSRQRRLEAATKERDKDPLRHMADVGFLDLDEQLVNALKAAGLRWGGDYKGAKDFMHFEVVH